MNDPAFFIILLLALGAMWLMTSRTRKQQKEATAFRANLAPGQDVMTGSGLFGTVVAVEDDVVTLETSPGVTSRWLRPAIAKLVEPPVEEDGGEDEVAEGEAVDADGAPAYEVPDDASSLTRGDEDDERLTGHEAVEQQLPHAETVTGDGRCRRLGHGHRGGREGGDAARIPPRVGRVGLVGRGPVPGVGIAPDGVGRVVRPRERLPQDGIRRGGDGLAGTGALLLGGGEGPVDPVGSAGHSR